MNDINKIYFSCGKCRLNFHIDVLNLNYREKIQCPNCLNEPHNLDYETLKSAFESFKEADNLLTQTNNTIQDVINKYNENQVGQSFKWAIAYNRDK